MPSLAGNTPQYLANSTLHEIIKAGVLPEMPCDARDPDKRGVQAAQYLTALYEGLVQMYQDAMKAK